MHKMEKTLTENRREKGIYKVTFIGSGVNFILLLFKFIAGILGHSAAMMADAVHSLSDFITDIVVVLFVRVSGKPQNNDYKYGHGKFETLTTLLIGLVLLFVGGSLAVGGIKDIISVINGATLPSPGMIALVAALVSIVLKEVLFRYTVRQGKKLNSNVVVANGWHHRSDAYSSVGTAIGIGGAILLGSQWTVLDPLAALMVSIFIVKSSLQLMKPCIDELMEKALPDDVEAEIEHIVCQCEGVETFHSLHTRKIGSYYAIEFHIKMDGGSVLSDAYGKITVIENVLKEKYGQRTHIMICMEPA